MKKLLFISTLLASLFFLSACGNKEVEPRAIDAQNDKCAQCNMAVADDEFATQLVLENGKVYTFDDIGCMFQWVADNEKEEIAAQFVRDYQTKEWLKVEDATYVYEQSIKTPMAYNVISFSDDQVAEKFASELDAIVMNGTEIKDHNWKMNKEMMMKMKEEKGAATMNHSHEEGEMAPAQNSEDVMNESETHAPMQ